jgi:hypothetical protein
MAGSRRMGGVGPDAGISVVGMAGWVAFLEAFLSLLMGILVSGNL